MREIIVRGVGVEDGVGFELTATTGFCNKMDPVNKYSSENYSVQRFRCNLY